MPDAAFALQQVVERNLNQSSRSVRRQALAGRQITVAYRRDFRLGWHGTWLHLFTVVQSTGEIDGDFLKSFTGDALALGLSRRGTFRGLQQAVGIIAVSIGERANGEAIAFAQRHISKGYAAFAWPVVVDASEARAYCHVGRPKIGWVYTDWMQMQIRAAIPAEMTIN